MASAVNDLDWAGAADAQEKLVSRVRELNVTKRAGKNHLECEISFEFGLSIISGTKLVCRQSFHSADIFRHSRKK